MCYKLWEASWQDDAVVKDRQRGIYADPRKVHDVDHDGKYFRVHGCHLAEPSPQRTPVLYQAGASPRGRRFAAEHAEGVFISAPSPQAVGAYIRDTRAAAAKRGRQPEDIVFSTYLKVITGGTEPRRAASTRISSSRSATRARWPCSAAGRALISAGTIPTRSWSMWRPTRCGR